MIIPQWGWQERALRQAGGVDALLRVRNISVDDLQLHADTLARHDEPMVRFLVARAGANAAIPSSILEMMLRDPQVMVRRAALASLVRRQCDRNDDDALIGLVAALKHGGDIAVAAAEVLGWLSDPRAVPDLLAAFKTTNEKLGRAVAEALGRCGDRAGLPWLTAAVRARFCTASCVFALGLLGDTRALPLLHSALEDQDPAVRASACHALMLVDSAPSLGLRACLHDASFDVRLAAAHALHHFHETAPLDALKL
jgi:HEAT repeat protein